MGNISKIQLEVLRNFFNAIVQDMARVVERTAFTTFVKETADFSTGLITPQGEFIAYPWSIGASTFLGINLGTAINFTKDYEEGDILIMNDPYSTGGLCTHLPDIHMLKPIFSKGEIVAFGYAFVHASDVGGAVPSSVWPRAREVAQEGLRMRPTKLFRAGVLQQSVVDVIYDNTRIPDMNWGDLKAMVAAVNTCERRVHDMIGKFGHDVFKEGVVEFLDHVETRARAVFSSIPNGTYEFVDYMEDDMISDVPVRLAVAMTVTDGSIHLDFSGTDPQVASALNMPTAGVSHPFLAQALLAYAFSQDRDMPKAGAVMRPISVKLDRGSVLYPEFPAACGVRFASVLRVTDVVLGALAKALPETIPAAGGGSVAIVVCSLMEPRSGKRHVSAIQPMIGGGGASYWRDGLHGCDGTNGYFRNTPVESVEADIPVVMRRYELLPDSAGAGRHRGGMGVRLDFQVYQPDAMVTARGQERYKLQPWGLAGGKCGKEALAFLNPDTSREKSIGKIDAATLGPGDVISIRTPGGGGYGNPFERDPQSVIRDVETGLVSVDAARSLYGVEIVNGHVDEIKTQTLRAHPTKSTETFDFGPFRATLERRWPSEVSQECAKRVFTLPTSVRDYAKRAVYDEVQKIAKSRVPTRQDVGVAWAKVEKLLERAGV